VAATPVVSKPRRHSKPHLSADGDGPATKLILAAGRADGLEPSDIIHAITAATGLDGESVRNVRMLERFSFVEVPESQAPRIVDSVDGTEVNGLSLRLEPARS
jgi:ATP-dependent RNA helicase DeaD